MPKLFVALCALGAACRRTYVATRGVVPGCEEGVTLRAFLACYSGLVGAGIALAYTAPLVAGWSWFPDARGFVTSLLKADVGARPSMAEVLALPWLVRDAPFYSDIRDMLREELLYELCELEGDSSDDELEPKPEPGVPEAEPEPPTKTAKP